MLPAEIQEKSDQELAKLVQLNGSNDAITEIINRHTGVYLSVVNSFNIPPLQKSDLLDSKNTNIYKYTLKFDDSKGCKLSSYFYNQTYYDCLKTLDKSVDTEEVTEKNGFSESFTYNDAESVKSITLNIARSIGGRDFEKIVEARHFGDSTGKVSWHKISPMIGGKSYEWGRQIYQQNLEKFKAALKEKFNYVTI